MVKADPINLKKVHLTFDYELFFGSSSGSVYNTILKPTDLILEILEKNNATATFFVDYLMLQKMKKASEKMKLDAESIEDQILRLIKAGNRIELHIHPHWLDAKFVDNDWDFSDLSRYRLHSLTENERRFLFDEGKFVLETLARKVSDGYTIRCFRAGGWCIQPFSILKDAFKSSGITIDSSVSFGSVSNSKVLKFDFTKVPDKEMYRFGNEVEVEDENGEFIEVPISYYNHNFKYRIENQIDKQLFPSRYLKFGDGCHNGHGADNTNPKKRILFSEKRMLSIDGIKPRILLNELRKGNKTKFVLISHPKDVSERSLDVLRKLCKSNEFIITHL